MAHSYDHLREKAIQLRTQHNMTLDEIVERLALPKTTIYYWIKDIRVVRRKRERTLAQIKGTEAMKAKYTAKREEAYQQGVIEAPELIKNPLFRDFVVLYMAEGAKRDRNKLSFVNSNPRMVKLAHDWLKRLSSRSFYYALQYHADHDPEALKMYWAELLGIQPDDIRPIRKSNSNQLSGRQFRSIHGLLTVETGDTYLRARMQAWMDFMENQW